MSMNKVERDFQEMYDELQRRLGESQTIPQILWSKNGMENGIRLEDLSLML